VFSRGNLLSSTCLKKHDHAENPKIFVVNRDGKGSLEEVKSLTFSKQPLPSFDWSPDLPGLYAAVGFDKMIHIGFVSKVN